MKLYRCPVCGNVVEKVLDQKMPVSCCGKVMEEITANTTEAAVEKHLPVVNVKDNQLIVEVGEVTHPMGEDHYITMIMVVYGNHSQRVDLSATDEPKAIFSLGDYKGEVEVYEYCNLHGLWKTNVTL